MKSLKHLQSPGLLKRVATAPALGRLHRRQRGRDGHARAPGPRGPAGEPGSELQGAFMSASVPKRLCFRSLLMMRHYCEESEPSGLRVWGVPALHECTTTAQVGRVRGHAERNRLCQADAVEEHSFHQKVLNSVRRHIEFWYQARMARASGFHTRQCYQQKSR